MESRRQIGRKAWSNHKVKALVSAICLSILFIVDRVTKLYALEHFNFEHVINPFLSFELVFNRGVSWGLFHGSSTLGFMLLTAVILVGTLVFSREAYKKARQGENVIGELLIITGSVSNMLDRVLYNGVIDFIVVHYGAWSWPVFNIADASIVLGVGSMIIQLIKQHNATI